jgi:hypothetical protein
MQNTTGEKQSPQKEEENPSHTRANRNNVKEEAKIL